MRRTEPDAAGATTEAFKILRDDAGAFLTTTQEHSATTDEQVKQLLQGDRTAIRATLSAQLADYLRGHDLQLIAFVQAHLLDELVFWFAEELKADRPESNRAWRAFQRLLLEGLHEGLADVKVQQDESLKVLRELQAWAQRMQATPPDSRDDTGQAALEQVVLGARDQLLGAISRESGLTRAIIETGISQIAQLLQEELAGLRKSLLTHLEEYGLAEGKATLPVDLRRLFDGLLLDHALFGGRKHELLRIEDFLGAPGGGYMFVTGPSGYGKTALLAHWLQNGAAIYAPAYHFISRTYATADEEFFLRNLCQQLVARHGLSGRLPAATSELRALYASLLRLPPPDGHPVVILVDGLDEAMGWDPMASR